MTQSEQRNWFVGLLPAVSNGVALIVVITGCLSGCSNSSTDKPSIHSLRDVYPGNDIQAVLDAVAKDTGQKHVKVHAGVYRPRQHGQALIWLNERHDGITLEAVGEVILTAANPDIAKAFFRAGYIEHWGRGTVNIIEYCKQAGLPEPDFR